MNAQPLIHCDACGALANPVWPTCAACSEPLSAGSVNKIKGGDWITWTRSSGDNMIGQVDFVHRDAEGTMWAFVSQGTGWTAVNCKLVTVLK